MKIHLSVHQKAGAPEFGSDGIGAEMELDLDQAILQAPDSFPARFDDGYEPARNGHRSNGSARSDDGDGRRFADDAPRDGRQLLAWARKNDASDDVMRIGRNWKLPNRVVAWERSEVEDVYREVLAKSVGVGRWN